MADASGPRSSGAVDAKAPQSADSQARACCRSAAKFLRKWVRSRHRYAHHSMHSRRPSAAFPEAKCNDLLKTQ